jgi:4-amino-4-deoxy-L-arabinose transferase
MKTKKYIIAVLGFYILGYLLFLGAQALFVPDETRYAEVPREMIAGGDWVTPHLDGVRYFEKPVLGYWVTAGSILLLGENNFAVRLPSALAAGLSALLVFLLVWRSCRNAEEESRMTAILAALIFLSCAMVFGLGVTAELDSLFSCLLTATIAVFYFATEAPPGSARERRLLLLSGVFCGLAFLTKGFLAFAVPVLALAPYLVWQHRYRDVLRMSWLPILTAVLVALPWGIAIHLREPDFWRYFFWNEHIHRFVADNAQHKRPFWYFFIFVPVLIIPWTFLVPAAASGLRQPFGERGMQGRLVRLSICWLLLPFLFFSASSGKLLTYILPCFPPFAVLMALGLGQAMQKDAGTRLFQWGTIANAILFGLILAAFLVVHFLGYHELRFYSQPLKALIVVNALGFYLLLCHFAFWSRTGRNKAFLFGLSPLLLFATVHFMIPDQTLEVKAPGVLLERYAHRIQRDAIVIADEGSIGAACWYLRRSDLYLLGDANELRYGMKYKDASGRWLNIKSALALINQNRGRVVLIARGKNVSRWRDWLPQPDSRDDSGPRGYVIFGY